MHIGYLETATQDLFFTFSFWILSGEKPFYDGISMTGSER